METKIARRPLGKTGLSVSEVSFGAMNLRTLNTLGETDDILNYVIDQGINLIDTARGYNGKNKQGEFVESEVLVGSLLRQRTDIDEPIVVVTKGHGYTLDEFEKDLNTSLAKLGVTGTHNLRIGQTDVRIVYFFHGINAKRWATISTSGVLDKIQELKQAGVINHIGFSSHYGDTKEIKAAVDTGIFEVVELPYNIFNRSLGEDGKLNLLEYIYNKQIGIINMKAFSGNGMPAIYRMLKDLITIDYGTMLNFCLSNPYITTVDAGARLVSEFAADLETAIRPRLTKPQMTDLRSEADKVSKHMHNICRECMHCLEKFSCPQNVNFPEILALYARHTISEQLDRDSSYPAQYRQLDIDSEACIECGACIPWCEYKLDIPKMLKQAHQALGSSV